MKPIQCAQAVLICLSTAVYASAQATPPPAPPPLWDAEVGASFVGTSGNSDTASTGIEFGAHRRGVVWLADAGATLVRTSSNDVTTAERYLATLAGRRKLTDIIGIATGIRLERDQFAGL